jgi:hypothetical protein
MKKFVFTAIAIGFFAFKSADTGTISGKVTPADAASQVWAFQGTDTIKAPVTDGAFTVQGTKAGTYTVIIGAKRPFQDVTVTNVKVEDGKATDLGEIRLQQE